MAGLVPATSFHGAPLAAPETSMTLLVLGLILFLGIHAFTMARGPRAAMIARLGEGGYKGAYTLLSLAGFVLIVWGYVTYRWNGYIPVYQPPTALRHLALLLLLPVFPLLAAGKNGLIRAKLRHPMLLAVKIWALAHLLANGDLGSILLFGSFLAWAVAARISVKSRETGAAAVPATASWTKGDTIAVAAGLALYLATILFLHHWLVGVPVLPGW